MDQAKGVDGAAGGGVDVTEKKTLSQGKADWLEKCLEENKGDNIKCKDKVEAFRSTSSSSSLSSSPPRKLERCLEENKGDDTKCKDKVEAFRSSSSSSSPSSSPPRKPLTPLKLRSGSLTDV